VEILREDDRLASVAEKLQRLEMRLEQLANRAPEMPADKERLLLDSWDRIKCMEVDLEKTKKVQYHLWAWYVTRLLQALVLFVNSMVRIGIYYVVWFSLFTDTVML
jgi:hypothetical protein